MPPSSRGSDAPPSLLNSPAYRAAFERYMRTGAPIRIVEHKADTERPTTHYIWRTQRDGRVRAEHRANEGRIFSWDDPPPTGHPGEDYGCRCWAEAYYPEVQEYARQTLIRAAPDAAEKWTDGDFVGHYRSGTGSEVALEETGHLRGVIRYFSETLGVYNRINRQIIEKARRRYPGPFRYPFENSYNFSKYLYVFGKGTVSGRFEGSVYTEGPALRISGSIIYVYFDTFTDPTSIREGAFGTSDPQNVEPWVRDLLAQLGGRIDRALIERAVHRYLRSTWLMLMPELAEPLAAYLVTSLENSLDAETIAAGLVDLTDPFGTGFDITGTWETAFEAQIATARDHSEYR